MVSHKYCENINRMGNLTSELVNVIYKQQYWRKISKMAYLRWGIILALLFNLFWLWKLNDKLN